MVLESDAQHRLTYLSPRFAEVTGANRDDFLGKTLVAIVNPDPFRGFRCRFAASGMAERFWSMSGAPVFAADGAFRGYRGTVTDVTHEIQAQAAANARELAESASHAKSEFLANMSHELRTPLNAIIGFSEAMKSGVFGPMPNVRYAEYAALICSSGKHLLDIINDILDLSKVEAGRLEIYEENVDVGATVEQVAAFLRDRAVAGGLRLTTDLDPELPWLRGDARMLRQVAFNLLSNAIKFTPVGGVVALGGLRDGGGNLVLTFTDTGIGIAEADMRADAVQPDPQQPEPEICRHRAWPAARQTPRRAAWRDARDQ